MPPRARHRIQPVVATLTLVALAVLVSRRADSDELESRFVKVSDPWLSTVTTLYAKDPKPGEAEVRPRINLKIKNRSERAFWFWAKLTPPPPHSGRSGTAHLEPGQEVEFESTQDSILADTDYQFEIQVFSDRALSDTLGVSSAQFRFPARAVRDAENRIARELRARASKEEAERREVEKLMEARRLPKTYERVIFVEGTLSLLGVTSFSPRGTLIVRADSLHYVSKKRAFAIAGAQLRTIAVLEEHGQPCVAVEYVDGGATRHIHIFTGVVSGQGDLPKLEASLTALKEQSAKPD